MNIKCSTIDVIRKQISYCPLNHKQLQLMNWLIPFRFIECPTCIGNDSVPSLLLVQDHMHWYVV